MSNNLIRPDTQDCALKLVEKVLPVYENLPR